jgi:hypothetical protein
MLNLSLQSMLGIILKLRERKTKFKIRRINERSEVDQGLVIDLKKLREELNLDDIFLNKAHLH